MKIYETDPEACHLLRAFMALALWLIDSIREGFEILKEKVTNSSQSNQLESFISYFKSEWLNYFKPSTRYAPNST